MIELGGLGAGALPPAWVDVYEEAQEKTRKIKDICIKILCFKVSYLE